MQLGNMSKKDSDHRLPFSIQDLDQANDSHHSTRKNAGGAIDPSSASKSSTDNVKNEKKLKKKAYASFLERLSDLFRSRKILVGSFLCLSLIFHFLTFEAIYRLSQTEVANEPEAIHKVAIRIKPPNVHEVRDESVAPKKIRLAKKTKKILKSAKTTKKRVKTLSPKELGALGKKYIGMVLEGTFPLLTLSYNNPYSYIREMYDVGAKTVVHDTVAREYYEIDLFTGEILPCSRNDFKGFSSFKRVIKDYQWHSEKMRVAKRLKTSPNSLEILLLVPMSVETLWIGYQVTQFQKMNLQILEVETVEAHIQKGKLRLVRVYLKDGSSRDVNDYIGV